jgi:ribonuclease R
VLDRVLGPAEDRKLDSLAVIYAFGLPIEFPAEVEAEAQSFGTDPRSEDIAGRRDLRGWTTFTIDGADAKDFDDAVSLNRLDNGNWQLGVHIADVSHYVRARSALDEEALSRATSVYLLDRVVPMLPEALSNGLCSLRPDVDRLTMSAIMEIAPDGRQVQAEIVESVIHSHNRFTYDEVNAVLEGDPEARARFTQYVPILEDMNSLAQTLTRVRMERGMIEFEQSESDITLDDTGEVIDVQPGTRTAADNLIEQFMLQANETVAERYYWQEVPFIYRVHEEPDPDRVESLNNLLGRFGLQVRAGRQKMHPRVFQAVLLEVEGHPQEPLISRVMLRTMRRARYSPECLGHFGLAARYYCHFTSPIRRYPDLAIHRIIKETLHGTLSEKRVESLKFFVARAADISSEREQLATEAERELDSIKKVQFMAKHVGEEFDGIISGVTSFGFFVELPSTIEGLVHVSSLTDDYYQFIERDFALLGQAAHRRFQLGDSVRILVSRVDEMEGLVDFELVGLQEQQPGESYVQDPTEVSVHRPAKHHEKRAGKKAEVRKERRFAR